MTETRTAAAELWHGDGRPLWQQIHDILLDEIRENRLEEPGRLPPAGKLASRFGVNRHTVRQALRALDDEGVTVTRQGAQAAVAGHVVDYPISNKTRFSEIIIGQGMEPSGRILRIKRKAAGKAVAAALGIAVRDRIVLIERISAADRVTIGLARHHFAVARVGAIEDALQDGFGISVALLALGIGTYYRKSTTVTARLPSAREARLLGQSPSEPVLWTTAVNVDADGQPLEYGETIFSASRVRLRFDDTQPE